MRWNSMRMWAAAVLSAALLELPFPIAGPMPPWRSIFAWFGLVPLLWAIFQPCNGRPSSPPPPRVFARIRLRRALVHGQLLLDPRHHDALRRHARRCSRTAAHWIQSRSRSLLRIIRSGGDAGSSGNGENPSRPRRRAFSLGCARSGRCAHHQRAVGSTWLFAS